MNYLPLINFYPISDHPVSKQEIFEYNFLIQNGHKAKLREQITVRNPYDFLVHSIKNYAISGVVNQFESLLIKSEEFKNIKKSMQFLKDVPNIRKYRLGDFNNNQEVDNEIKENGKRLDPEQVVFHGGRWPINFTSQIITDKPLSTSFSPGKALKHTFIDNSNDVWMLKQSKDCQKKVYVFTTNSRNMGHEFEVLFEAGLKITMISFENLPFQNSYIRIITAEIS